MHIKSFKLFIRYKAYHIVTKNFCRKFRRKHKVLFLNKYHEHEKLKLRFLSLDSKPFTSISYTILWFLFSSSPLEEFCSRSAHSFSAHSLQPFSSPVGPSLSNSLASSWIVNFCPVTEISVSTLHLFSYADQQFWQLFVYLNNHLNHIGSRKGDFQLWKLTNDLAIHKTRNVLSLYCV